MFGRFINGVTSIIAMMIYNPMLALIAVSFCLMTVYISIKMNQQIKKMDKDIQNKISKLTARFSDILLGFTTLKMFRGSSIVLDLFQSQNNQATNEEKQKSRKLAVLEMMSFFLGILASFGTISVGAFLVVRGKIDYGTIMAIVSLQMGVRSMVQSFGSAWTTFSSSLVKAGRVFDFLELDCEESGFEKPESPYIIEPQNSNKPIEVINLTFSYNKKIDVFKHFFMEVKNNEKIIIMGESGCGKSTLLKLFMRFYRQNLGKIKLYGYDINKYSLWQLRQLITYIPHLFEGSICENIAFGYSGTEQVSEEEIVKAAKLAYADEFIVLLPQGYNTFLEAGGSNLSGGQRQRIAIARAFLRDSPILLMDEPSSALDIESEQKINQAMQELTRQKVVIMVTHRSTSLEAFNRVVRL